MKALIVGCGLSGSVAARELAEKGYDVLILERRNHIGGNMYDYIDDHGILVHQYGPHTFHTKDKSIYDYICRFDEWVDYKLTCGAVIKGKCTPTPFNYRTIDQFFSENEAENIKKHIETSFPGQNTATILEMLNHEDLTVRKYALFLFEHDYTLYTAKQWGINPADVDPSILKRVPVRFNYDVGYFDDTYQCMPKVSYTNFFRNLLNHPNIKIELNTDGLRIIKVDVDKKQILVSGTPADFPVIYTGPIDELFNFRFGALPYRSLRFEWKYKKEESLQDMPVVAYPEAQHYTRITEYKKLPVQQVKGTSYAVEYPLMYEPSSGLEPYYPLLTNDSQITYKKYQQLSANIDELIVAGRLGCFKYYNMDEAIKSIFYVFKQRIIHYK